MGPDIQNFEIAAGDDEILQFTVSSDDPEATLEEVTIYWWCARTKWSSIINIEKDSSTGIMVTDSVNRIFTVPLSRADTLNMSGDYYHEAKVVDATTGFITTTTGIMTVNPTIVRTVEDV